MPSPVLTARNLSSSHFCSALSVSSMRSSRPRRCLSSLRIATRYSLSAISASRRALMCAGSALPFAMKVLVTRFANEEVCLCTFSVSGESFCKGDGAATANSFDGKASRANAWMAA